MKHDTVFLVENDPTHAAQITKYLTEHGLEVFHSLSGNEYELYNFRALKSQGQVIVMDLELGLDGEVDVDQGLRRIRFDMWPFDRTAFFVIFSQHISWERIVVEDSIDPHWTIVPKQLTTARADRDATTLESSAAEGYLTDKSLKRLFDVVSGFLEHTSASVSSAIVDLRRYSDVVAQYEQAIGRPIGTPAVRRVFDSALLRSVAVINSLAEGALSFRMAGRKAASIAVAVYGSCGRLEMSLGSDVEFGVFFDDTNTELERRLVASFWSRTARLIVDADLEYEGRDIVSDNPHHFLRSDQVGVLIENRYNPTFGIDTLAALDLRKRSEHRNRHFQVLTELRAIFNPGLILKLKRKIISEQIGDVRNLMTLVQDDYIRDITQQFLMDAGAQELRSWGDLKRLCTRTLNVLSLRIWLLSQVHCRDIQSLTSDDQWDRLFDGMTWPGVLKVVDAAASFRRLALDVRTKDVDAVESVFSHAIQRYLTAWAMLADYDDRAVVSTTPRDNAEIPRLDFVGDAVTHLCNVVAFIREQEYGVLSRDHWLFDTNSVSRGFMSVSRSK